MTHPDSINIDLAVVNIPLWRRFIYGCVAVGIGVCVFLVVAELICRLLPVNEGLRTQPVNAASPVYRFEPNRTSTWSRGWNFSMTNRVHVNNDGFVNDQDYSGKGSRPLIAVVGDSYVEALMVPYRETVQGRLAEHLDTRGRVYSFAASGAGLSQYLVWAEHAKAMYKPDMFLFLNISNDFTESLYHMGRSPGFHHFERTSGDMAELRRVNYEPTFFRKVFRHSALAMYLITNVKIESALNLSLQYFGSDTKRWAANISRDGTEQEYLDYQWAVRVFLDRLPTATGLPPGQIIIAIDGLRAAVYVPDEKKELTDSVWGRMRRYMADQAQSRGFVVIDMQPVFEKAYALEKKRFEFPTDSHWNGYAHGLLAEAIRQTEIFGKLSRNQNK